MEESILQLKTSALVDQIRHLKRKIRCDLCSKEFQTNKGLIYHAKIIHEGKRHECDICKNTFHSLMYLKTHKVKLHGEERHQIILNVKLAISN